MKPSVEIKQVDINDSTAWYMKEKKRNYYSSSDDESDYKSLSNMNRIATKKKKARDARVNFHETDVFSKSQLTLSESMGLSDGEKVQESEMESASSKVDSFQTVKTITESQLAADPLELDVSKVLTFKMPTIKSMKFTHECDKKNPYIDFKDSQYYQQKHHLDYYKTSEKRLKGL